MSQTKLIRMSGILLLVSGILLLVWWILMGVLLPSTTKEIQLVNLVLNKGWLFVNLIGLIGMLLLPLGLVGLYYKQHEKVGIMGLIGFIFAFLGTILYICVQFEETFMWPIIAANFPKLLEAKGPIFTNNIFSTTYIIMGVLFIVGFILISAVSILKAILPRIASVFLLIGAILFGAGMFIPLVIRTIGITLFSISLCWLGFAVFRDTKGIKRPSYQMPESKVGGMNIEE